MTGEEPEVLGVEKPEVYLAAKRKTIIASVGFIVLMIPWMYAAVVKVAPQSSQIAVFIMLAPGAIVILYSVKTLLIVRMVRRLTVTSEGIPNPRDTLFYGKQPDVYRWEDVLAMEFIRPADWRNTPPYYVLVYAAGGYITLYPIEFSEEDWRRIEPKIKEVEARLAESGKATSS